ncbi:LamG-like jellyroll fold domain-containing protein [Tamlana sp. 2_MG-2023]|uniref:LamG-like jellyroll fold domain-containing protein n=1 Tax=unclassified Tamlana TaxID=2614803 RepID=UPI0026E1D20A|nr:MULTISPECIES: LamG-like jellyroll fold domain-containing protein [unclassified Tamlana]MDO6761105.1 LamG-like jellyroll fold domain-containing protein [Tamlana sp. 2_MG-2023]MDO6791562.1 LamG-like jellyroll fold domain-containing protein [Tamlana sp. 1_MG-2023]
MIKNDLLFYKPLCVLLFLLITSHFIHAQTNIVAGIIPTITGDGTTETSKPTESGIDKLTDNDPNTYWAYEMTSGNVNDGTSVAVVTFDLGGFYSLNNIVVEQANNTRAYQYIVESSTNGTNYIQQVDRSSNTDTTSPWSDSFSINYVRYLRVTFTGAANYNDEWISISNMEVYTSSVGVFADTDGDGVTDNIDIDDDNDGILDSVETDICETRTTTASYVEVVVLNEDFGSGTDQVAINKNYNGASSDYAVENDDGDNVSNGKYTVYHTANSLDVATWGPADWGAAVDHTTGDTNGRMAIFDGKSGSELTAYEIRVDNLDAGSETEFSFYAVNLDIKNPPQTARKSPRIRMDILDPNNGNIQITAATSVTLPKHTEGVLIDPKKWTLTTGKIPAGFTSIIVRLTDEIIVAEGNDFAIDDIRVVQKFCDSDGDGIADILDIDDDNDGIPNMVELGISSEDTNSDGTLYGDTDWVDSNGNGMRDDFESGQSNYLDFNSNADLDFDGDSVPDYLDLDSDNDGIFDTLEYDGFGDIDITGNGVGDGTDTDGDGLLDIKDTLDGFGLNGYPDPIETTSGTPDYLNVQSDGTNYDILAIEHLYPGLDSPTVDGVIDDTTDADQDGIMDALDTDTSNFGSPRAIDGSYSLYFDGYNDYVETTSFLNNTNEGTMMCWVKIDPTATGGEYIMGQENISFIYTGTNIDFFVESNLIGQATVTKGKWIHLTGTYSSTNGESFYINGQEVNNTTNNSGVDGSGTNFIIGRSPSALTSFFKGEIDEVRIFNEALSQEDIQRMMCQELDETATPKFSSGKIIPKEIKSNLNTSLIRYYRMDTYLDDQLIDLSNSAVDATIYNVKNIFSQTAPMPYVTKSNTGNPHWGDPNSWMHGDVWDIPNSESVIVNIKHDITNRPGTGGNGGPGEPLTHLGLIVDPNTNFEVHSNKELKNTWYLDIGDDGLIDLQGEGQLVQTEESTLGNGNGVIERDQEGTTNKYSYNYWSSPVNSNRTNSTYTVSDVLWDTPGNHRDIYSITFNDDNNFYDGDDKSNDITIAGRWIYIYSNRLSNNYWQWQQVFSKGTIKVGEGYTMKGVGGGAISNTKSYVFIGSPNNGLIELDITTGNEYLIGNPYPSAIDANLFITDNQSVITGSLYYWDHVGGDSHYLADYEGSYATYNLSGTAPSVTAPSSPPAIADDMATSKTAERYIPVAQGFFVEASSTSGKITFQNSQRVFERENLTNSESTFIKETSTKTSKTTITKLGDIRPKIRLKYSSPLGYQRQLLTTVDTSATKNIDWGYDARLTEVIPEDLSWEIENGKYVIQGINKIDETTILPLIVKTRTKASDSGGIITFSIDSLENDAQNYNVYLKDFDTYHDLKKAPYDATVGKGETSGRFALAFSDQTLNIEDENNKLGVQLFYKKQNAHIIINNPNNTNLESLTAVNTLGQIVYNKQINSTQNRLEIPIHLADGLYVFSVKTGNTEVSKKVIVAE